MSNLLCIIERGRKPVTDSTILNKRDRCSKLKFHRIQFLNDSDIDILNSRNLKSWSYEFSSISYFNWCSTIINKIINIITSRVDFKNLKIIISSNWILKTCYYDLYLNSWRRRSIWKSSCNFYSIFIQKLTSIGTCQHWYTSYWKRIARNWTKVVYFCSYSSIIPGSLNF